MVSAQYVYVIFNDLMICYLIVIKLAFFLVSISGVQSLCRAENSGLLDAQRLAGIPKERNCYSNLDNHNSHSTV
jgi:hypothetical protein